MTELGLGVVAARVGLHARAAGDGFCGASGGALAAAEDGFEGWDRGAGYGDSDFDDGPEVDGDAVAEGIGGFGVDADGVEADDGGCCGEGADAEDEEEGYFIAFWALDVPEGGDGEGEDPKVGDYVKGGGDYGG